MLKVKNHFEADINQIKEAVAKLTNMPITAIGIGVPGILSNDETRLAGAANLGDWVGKDIIGSLKTALKVGEVHLCHDVKAAALSESMFGDMTDNFAFIIWGTGIGCSYVRYTDRKPSNFQQVELGYQTITKTIELEGVTYPGYLEYHCGGGRLPQRFGKSAAELTESEWNTVLDDLSFGIANLLMLNHAPTLVFSGGVAAKQAHRLPKLAELVGVRIRSKVLPKIQLAKYGEDAGLIGALGLIKHRQSGNVASNSSLSESISFAANKPRKYRKC
jgi:predicted NBD/HSP70 family sugar kinase